jgi:hypothetical protein
MISDELRSEIVATVEAADVCCEEQVCDMVLAAAERGDDWQATLAAAKDNDTVAQESLVAPAGYCFATDSEFGVIFAANFEAACQRLCEKFTRAAIDDGAWGRVEDVDGHRFELGHRPRPYRGVLVERDEQWR